MCSWGSSGTSPSTTASARRARPQSPPCSELEVFGVGPTPPIEAALKELGFRLDSRTADGFVAFREPA